MVGGPDDRQPPEVDGGADPQVVVEEHVAGEPVTVDEGDQIGLLGPGLGEDRGRRRVRVVERRRQGGPGLLELQGQAARQQITPPIGAQVLLGEQLLTTSGPPAWWPEGPKRRRALQVGGQGPLPISALQVS